MSSLSNQQKQDAILFRVCKDNNSSDEAAFSDFELIQNMLSYMRVHNLQQHRTAKGRLTKAFRTLPDQLGVIIEKHIADNNKQ